MRIQVKAIFYSKDDSFIGYGKSCRGDNLIVREFRKKIMTFTFVGLGPFDELVYKEVV